MIVSVFHSIFDFLAFKNGNDIVLYFVLFTAVMYLNQFLKHVLYVSDIQFWNKNKSMEGLSAKSVVVNFFCQLIVFLYLLDNETSWMILASSGIGCCIEFWKIGKAMHIEVCVSLISKFYTVYTNVVLKLSIYFSSLLD